MAFILGVGCKISDTREPIWMKLWRCIELTMRLSNVVFSTSGLVLKTGNWNFPENSTVIPCNIFLGFLIFPKLKYFQNDSKSFRMPQAWIKTPKFAAKRPRGCPAVFLPTPKMNAILVLFENTNYWPYSATSDFPTSVWFFSKKLWTINEGASFRWSFGPLSAWGSIESTTILTTHPSLLSRYHSPYPLQLGIIYSSIIHIVHDSNWKWLD